MLPLAVPGLIVAAKADLAVPGTIEALRELYAGRGGQTLGESGTGKSNALRSVAAKNLAFVPAMP